MKGLLFFQSMRFKKIVQESSWVFLGQAGSILAQLALIKVSTNFMPVNEYGIFSILLVYALLVERTIMTIQAGINRFYCEADQLNQLPDFWKASKYLLIKPSKIVLLVGSIIALIFFFLGQNTLVDYALILTPFTIFMGWNTAMAGLHLAARHRRLYSSVQLLEPCLRLISVILMVSIFGPSVKSLVIAYLLASIPVFITLLLLTTAFLERISANFKGTYFEKSSVTTWVSKIWIYSWPFSIWGVLAWLQQASDKFSLEYTHGSESVGFYIVLFQIGFMPMLLLTSMIGNLITPIVFKQYSTKIQSSGNSNSMLSRDSLLLFSFTLISVFTIAFATLSSFWHYQIMSIFISPDYLSYSSYLPLMILAGGFTSLGQIFATKIMAEKRTKLLLVGNIIYAVIALTANFFSSLHFGIPGVVYAVMLSAFLYVLLFSLLSKISTPQAFS